MVTTADRHQAKTLADTIRNNTRIPTGYIAADQGPGLESETYAYMWSRDAALSSLADLPNHPDRFAMTMQAQLDILRRLERRDRRLSRGIEHQLSREEDMLPAKLTVDGSEVGWVHRQWDTWAWVLRSVAIGERQHVRVLRDDVDRALLGMLVRYWWTQRIWDRWDWGLWEADRRHWDKEVHASSVDAVRSAVMEAMPLLTGTDAEIGAELIQHCAAALDYLGERESLSKRYDLASIMRIGVLGHVDPTLARWLLDINVKALMRDHGFIRHYDDPYPQEGLLAQWPMGFCWTAMAELALGNVARARAYQDWATDLALLNPDVPFPELFTGDGKPVRPLTWFASTWLVAERDISMAEMAGVSVAS